ncbi:transposase family protein [Nocardia sp. CA-135953]|uniref:transposase family protein n=1 Tax=Nocardia sp. CA-135953 TaxID=3239978 RepID=UPI003D970514
MSRCSDLGPVRVLFPHLDGLRIEVIRAAGSMVRIEAVTSEDPVGCPGCGMLSGRVHSRYRRQLSDISIIGREVVIGLRIRRLVLRQLRLRQNNFRRASASWPGRTWLAWTVSRMDVIRSDLTEIGCVA